MLTEKRKQCLIELLYQMADDELVIGHRDSEWLGLAPHIEADIAFASIAQDEIGHATICYRLLEELGEGKADDLAFGRLASARRNAVLLERPNGEGTYLKDPDFDWAYTIVRRLAYDLFDAIRLEVASQSAYTPLAQVAAKIRREEKYHLLHHSIWLKRLAQGTPESRRRLEEALKRVIPEVGTLFELGGVNDQEIFPASSLALAQRWREAFAAQCQGAGISWDGDAASLRLNGLNGRQGEHTPQLRALLETMSEVYRSAPGAAW
jgi:ring-1,2-phenylacetyl-CoA epoxidase subunit PaaC